MEETGDEPLFCERATGIDIGKQALMVTIRIPGVTRRGGRQQETREFGTTSRQLLALADWLRRWGAERAGMEKHQRLLEARLLPAGAGGLRLRPLPRFAGQGTPGTRGEDKLDSAWLAKVTGRGRWPARSSRRRTSAGSAPVPATSGG